MSSRSVRLTVLEAEKSKVKALVDALSGDERLPVFPKWCRVGESGKAKRAL